MSKRTAERPEAEPSDEYREITIEVCEEVARRLEASAAKYARYRTAGDVAAECVTLYLELLEALDESSERLKKHQINQHLKRATKAPAKRAHPKIAGAADRNRAQDKTR